MRTRIVGTLAGLVTSAGLALAQPAPSTPSASAPQAPVPAPVVAAPMAAPPTAFCEGPPLMVNPPPNEYPFGHPARTGDCGFITESSARFFGACDPREYPTHEGDVHYWASAEYLLWWMKNAPVVGPLVTTSSPANLGILGRGDTSIVFDSNDIDFNAFSGGRFTAGFMCSYEYQLGLEFSGFVLERRDFSFGGTSTVTGTPLLARPFINPITGTESSLLISSPGQFTGDIFISSQSQLFGAEASIVGNFYKPSWGNVGWLAGFRFMELDENLLISQDATVLPGGSLSFAGSPALPGDTVSILDQFSATNQFYGGQVGVRGDWHRDRFLVEGSLKVGIGATREVLNVGGGSLLNSATRGQVPAVGGMLAVSSNIGRISHDEFSVLPEFGLKVGVELCKGVRLTAGYNLLYWSDVIRPGQMIDRTVNPTLVPVSASFGTAAGAPRPTTILQQSDFWAQGMTIGLEIVF